MTHRPILLFGGTNRERLVSVATAQTLVELLDDPRCWFWAPDGKVHEIEVGTLRSHAGVFEKDLDPGVDPFAETIQDAIDSVRPEESVIVLGLHGGEGEDGRLPGWLEERGIPFTGSGSEASALAFDKVRAKQAVAAAGVEVADSRHLDGSDRDEKLRWLHETLASSGRLVVKPVAEGSSYGLEIIGEPDALDSFLDGIDHGASEAFLAEPFIEGVELTVGVIERDEELLALPSVEIRAEKGRVFDYAGKYLGSGIREICPGEVSADIELSSRTSAVRAHQALGCSGYSRSDFIIDGQVPVFLETNTLPGLTKSSLLPQELAAAGISMKEFLGQQIELAVRRSRAG